MHTKNIAISKHFIKATKDILSTMAGLDSEAGCPFVKKDHPQAGDISAVIGVTGACNGTVSVSFTRDAAMTLLHGMLGDDIRNLEEDMEDVVGEISNMVSGQARAGLAAEDLLLQGSTPTIITGAGHSLHHTASGQAVVIPFNLGESSFTVEFCFDAFP